MSAADAMTAAVILAAGAGSRLGGGKLLLPWRGRPILAHVLLAAAGQAGLGPLVLVTGNEAEAVGQTVRDCGLADRIHLVHNPAWAEGMSTSLRCGLSAAAALAAGRPGGVLVLLGDQPLVGPAVLAALTSAYRRECLAGTMPPAAVPVYGGRRGNPVILSPELLPQLQTLTGDTGARDILRRCGDAVLRVPVDYPGVVRDIDTPEDYAALTAEPAPDLPPAGTAEPDT